MSNSRTHGAVPAPLAGQASVPGSAAMLCFYHARYDGFGNLTAKIVTKGTGLTSFSATYDGLNHAVGTTYDANGNSGVQGDAAYPYDVENRLAMDQGMYGTRNYVYDPWGKRVGWRHRQTVYPAGWDEDEKCGVYFYGVTGQKLAEYSCGYHSASGGDGTFYWSLKGYNVYFAGHMIQSNGVSVTTDRLGSVRKNGNGETFNYLPYGEERTPTADDREKFGTYFRDAVDPSYGRLSLDYADQRYYDRGNGRFLTPDLSGTADPSNPGSWNRYAYANADPINFFDPPGTNSYNPDGYAMECNFPAPGESYSCYWYPVGGGGGPAGGGGGYDPAPPTPGEAAVAKYTQASVNVALLKYMPLPAPCEGDIEKLTAMSNGKITLDSIISAAGSAAVYDGTDRSGLAGSMQYNDLFANSPNYQPGTMAGYTVASYFSGHAGTGAATMLGTNAVGVGLVFIRPDYVNGLSMADTAALVMHEALHTLGVEDPDIEKALGLKEPSNNINKLFGADCFGLKR